MAKTVVDTLSKQEREMLDSFTSEEVLKVREIGGRRSAKEHYKGPSAMKIQDEAGAALDKLVSAAKGKDKASWDLFDFLKTKFENLPKKHLATQYQFLLRAMSDLDTEDTENYLEKVMWTQANRLSSDAPGNHAFYLLRSKYGKIMEDENSSIDEKVNAAVRLHEVHKMYDQVGVPDLGRRPTFITSIWDHVQDHKDYDGVKHFKVLRKAARAKPKRTLKP